MNFSVILTAVASIMFLMVGVDKFLGFLEPPCSLQEAIPVMIWQGLGVLQILAGLLIWLPGMRRPVAGFFFLFMITFSIVHLTQQTYDIGGSMFMAVLLGLLLWNPSFITGKKSSK